MNECQVVELAGGTGTLLLDMRSYLGKNRRAQALSRDGGLTWTKPRSHPELIEPVCQASILRYSWPSSQDKSRILFSNPASEKRRNLTVRLSYDEGKSWPVARTLHSGPAAYSCLAVLGNGTIACLYERGDENAYEKISFASFGLDWLMGGEGSRAPRSVTTPAETVP
jgi:sialidase-1